MKTTELVTQEEQHIAGRRKDAVWFAGSLMIFHIDGQDTDGQFSLVETVVRPGVEPPMHVHELEDEMFYVVEGQVTVFIGQKQMTVKAGNTAFLPRTIPHTFRVDTPEARMLVYITPSGFEDYFRLAGEPAKDLEARPLVQESDIRKMVETAGVFGLRFMKPTAKAN